MTQNETPDFRHSIANKVCGKDVNMPFEECHKTKGAMNPLCKNSEQCRIGEKTSEQVDYIKSSIKENIFLKACPGSGKTEVVGVKAAYEMSKWDKPYAGMAILTFTNNATDVISDRVRQFTGLSSIPYPHYIGTFDSWLQGYIVQPFAHKVTSYSGKNGDKSITIIGENCKNTFLIKYKVEYPRSTGEKYQANEISFSPRNKTVNFHNNGDIGTITKELSDLEESVISDIQKKKQLFKADGWANYYDIDKIAMDLFKDNEILHRICKRFPYIIIDEAQDLSEMQFALLSEMHKNGVVIHYVGDINQSIYEFKGGDPELISLHISNNNVPAIILSQNHRSNQTIVDVHSRLVNVIEQKIRANIAEIFDTSCIVIKYCTLGISKLPEWFIDYIEQLNSSAEHEFCKISLDRIAIIGRGHKINNMITGQNNNKMHCMVCLARAIYLYVNYDRSHIDEALKLLGSFLDEYYFRSNIITLSKEYNRPKEYIKSTIKWRLFLYDMLHGISLIEGKLTKKGGNIQVKDFSQTWEEWVNFIKNFPISSSSDNYKYSMVAFIDDIIANCELFENTDVGYYRKHNLKQIQLSTGDKPLKVADIVNRYSEANTKVRVDTIHGVKGETFDAVMLVSNKNAGHDGYYKKWLADKNSEAARLAYVASSRPKHLLVWAIPDSADDEGIEKLKEIGFTVLDDQVSAGSESEIMR